jgi:hypothetical protein
VEFDFIIRRDPETLLRRVCAVAGDRVKVNGTGREGRFQGLFDGHYRVEGDKVRLFIRRKPAFVSWNLVQKGVAYLSA